MNKDVKKQNDSLQSLGDFLFKKRVKSDLTLRSFCLKHNVDGVFISKLERNKIEITDKLVPHIAKLYGVAESDIKNTNWEVDMTIDFPAFVPSHINSEEQIIKLLNAINND